MRNLGRLLEDSCYYELTKSNPKLGSIQNEHTSPNLKSNPGAKRKARDWGEALNFETKY